MSQPAALDVRFDGLVHFVPDLEDAVDQYRAFGIPMGDPRAGPVGTGIRQAAWYTRRLQYVEAIAVQDPALARGAYADWDAMEGLMRAGGGGGRVHLLVPDVAATVDRLRARGVPVGGPQGRSLTRPTGEMVRYQTARVLAGHPWDPFVINYGLRPDEMYEWRQARNFHASPWMVAEVVVETSQPQADAAWLADLLQVGMAPTDAEGTRVIIPGCSLLFVPGPAGQITEVRLDGPDAPTGEIARLRYRPAPVGH